MLYLLNFTWGPLYLFAPLAVLTFPVAVAKSGIALLQVRLRANCRHTLNDQSYAFKMRVKYRYIQYRYCTVDPWLGLKPEFKAMPVDKTTKTFSSDD
jgi:hypothetical protein